MTPEKREKKYQQRLEDLATGRVDLEGEKADRKAEIAARKEREKELLQTIRNLQRTIGRGTGGTDLTTAITHLGVRIGGSVAAVYGIGKGVIGMAQDNLAAYGGYSGQSIRAQVLSDVADLRRNIRISNATSGSMERFAQSMTKMKDAFAPLMIDFHNFVNEAGAGIADFAADFAHKAKFNMGEWGDVWKHMREMSEEKAKEAKINEEFEAWKAKPGWQAEKAKRMGEAVRRVGDEEEKEAARMRAMGFDEQRIADFRANKMASVLARTNQEKERAATLFETLTRKALANRADAELAKERALAKRLDPAELKKGSTPPWMDNSFEGMSRRADLATPRFRTGPINPRELMGAGGFGGMGRFGGFIAPHALVGPSGTGFAVPHPDMGVWGPAAGGRGGPRAGPVDLGPIRAMAAARERAMDEARAARGAEEVRKRELRRIAIEREQIGAQVRIIDRVRAGPEGRDLNPEEAERRRVLRNREEVLAAEIARLRPHRASRPWAMAPAAGRAMAPGRPALAPGAVDPDEL